MLDKKHQGKFPVNGMDYVFNAGEMGGHNVIITSLPPGDSYNANSMVPIANQAKECFPNLWFGLLIGVATGLPNPSRDIRLGDVLVCHPTDEGADIITYDLGKAAAKMNPVISAVDSIKLRAPNDTAAFLPHYEKIKFEEHSDGTFIDPGQDQDELHEDGDDEYQLVRQARPHSERTRVWYGPLGSGKQLLNDPLQRNELRDKSGIIGLDSAAMGVMKHIPVVIIRGVCDYGDGHKNTMWQPYAVAMAAAYAKAVLSEIPPKVTEPLPVA
jgi:nucleoside phosphorylase